jgi:hypothetical protein
MPYSLVRVFFFVAFLVLAAGPAAVAQTLDFGDAPDSRLDPGYPTLLTNNGARHTISGPFIGQGSTHAPDAESDGQPDPLAEGDDDSGSHDEQYFYFSTGSDNAVLYAGLPGSMGWYVDGGGGVVEIWIDFNGDQTWQHPDERVYSNHCADGSHLVTVTPPADAALGQTYARIRISRAGGLPPDGPADDGEVQDQRLYIAPSQVAYKWEQLPDLDETVPVNTRMVVNAADELILADDFLCREEGPITDIRLWGAWDGNNGWGAYYTQFTISFHADIPAEQSETGYSMPGELLWLRTFTPGNAGQLWMEPPENTPVGWFDPSTGNLIYPGDYYHFRYHLHVDEDEAFYQAGSLEEPIVYWMNVKTEAFHPIYQSARLGWMTSLDHWNDNAVWVIGAEPYSGIWSELYYPPGHQYAGQPIDLAFRLGEAIDPSALGADPRAGGLGLRLLGPNPLLRTTTIGFELPVASPIRLAIHAVDGRRIRTLADGPWPAGPQAVTWDGRDARGLPVPAGCYLYELSAAGARQAGRVIVIR